MINRAVLLLLFVAVIFNGYGQQGKSAIEQSIPSLESVSGVWINADTLGIQPSVRNFRAQALLNRDMASIGWFASAPYSGGYHTGVLKVNGKAPMAQLYRWYPWQALRKAAAPTYKIASAVRMVPDNNAVMWEITLTNSTTKTQHYNVEQDLIGFISHYPNQTWAWPYPYPTLKGKTVERNDEIVNVINNVGIGPQNVKAIAAEPNNKSFDSTKIVKALWPSDEEILNAAKYHIVSDVKNQLIIADTETDALTGFGLVDAPDRLVAQNSGGRAYWRFSLKPGASKKIRFFMVWGNDKEGLSADLNKLGNEFDETYAGVELTWKTRWQEMFTPHNSLISGCFPVLATKDKAVSKVYYAGPLTLLYLMDNNLPMHKRVYLTGGPRWGASITFYWDNTEWSQIMAMADPEVMKDNLRSFIHINPDKYFGQDSYSGNGIGNGYVANYWALFQLIRSYITMTKDYDFLNEVVDRESILDHITDYAYNWQKLSIYGQPGATDDEYKLADFGSDPWNLLECVPTYIHIVPSFNAGYVWMMRETAKFYTLKGDTEKAQKINTDADEMLHRLLKLYAGNGVWNSLYPDGKKVEVRHVLDFMYFGKYLSKDLSPQMRKEMVDFVYRELITDKWMRAQSLQDIAAKYSDRPDHGPLGAYDGWPAGTIDALTQLGYADKALQFYKSVVPVTNEGNWSQSHELWGDNKFNTKARVRIPERGWNSRDAVAGIDFSQVVLKCFMGFNPGIDSSVLQPVQKINFSGTLYHVLYGGEYYSVAYREGKTVMVKE